MRIPNMTLLAKMLIPPTVRGSLLVRFAYLLSIPFGKTIVALDKNAKETERRLKANGQVCKLKALLNDLYDQRDRRITITDAEPLEPVVVYQRTNGRRVQAYGRNSDNRLTVPTRGLTIAGYAFCVNIPAELESIKDSIQATTDKYRLATKKAQIKTT